MLMANPKEANHKFRYSGHSNLFASGSIGRKCAAAQSWLRNIFILCLAAGLCLAVGRLVAAAQTQLGSTAAVDGSTSSGNTLSNFAISSGSDRILIVATDDEEDT